MTAQNQTTSTNGTVGEQLLRAVLVVAILLLTPFLVWQFFLPIVLAHPLGIVVALALLAMMATGLYTIAEGELPSVLER